MKFKNFYNKKYEIIFAIYVGTGPVYWFPWMGNYLIGILKIILFLSIVIWPFLQKISIDRLQFPGGRRIFLLMIIFFLLSIPGMLIGDLDSSIYRFTNIIQIFSFVYACGFLIKRKTIEYVVFLSVRIFAFFCFISFALIVFVPDYVSPLNDGLHLADTGLGGSRTSWSPAIALFVPWIYSGVGVFGGYVILLVAVAMLGNQVLVAGRTGMVASVLPFLFYGIFRKNIKFLFFVLIIFSLIILFAINNLELLRLNSGGLGSRDDLNELSSGRVELIFGALGEIYNNPFMGAGSGVSSFGGVHNEILRAAVEGGIPYALSLAAVIFVALYRGWKGVVNKNWFIAAAFLTVLSGVVSSMFEPAGLLGSFNNFTFWWLCFSICVSTSSTKRLKSLSS